jgi:transposase-like protein
MAKIAKFQDPIFQDEGAAREALEAVLWPDGPICRHCGNADPDRIAKMRGKSARPGLLYCNECKREFTVTVGTVFERSKVPLTKWWMAAHMLQSGKNGVSAHEIHRTIGVSYKTAWFMMHRLREAMNGKSGQPMGGQGSAVQADETMYGHTSPRSLARIRHGRSARKEVIVALVEPKKGEARAFHMEGGVGAREVRKILVTNANRKSTLVSDESKLYVKVGTEFAGHQTVLHADWEYVNREGFTTNNVENFFSQFKRGMRGTYIHCEPQHLQRYLNEFGFRYSNRSGLGINDGERTALMLKGIEGKRLTYRPTN